MNENQNDKSNVDFSKRKFFKAGVIAAPIIVSMKGKPALALYARNNCTVSGNLSGNMSPIANDECKNSLYQGRTPGYWGQHPEQWKSCYYGANQAFYAGSYADATGNHSFQNGYAGDGTRFQQIFTSDTLFISTDTMMNIVQAMGWGDKYQLGAHACAAALNAALYGKSGYGYSLSEVISLYATYHTTHPVELKQTFEYLNSMGG